MATRDEQIAQQRAAREAAAKSTPKHPDPSTFDAELVTRRGKKITVTDEEFAVMLEKAGGFRTRLAKQLGVSSSAITHRIKRSKYLTEACKTIEETVLDLAEAALIAAAQRGEPWAVTFILKCKGRKRGWIERQEFTFGNDPEALPPPIVLPVHDAGYVEAERRRQKEEFAEIVDAAVVEMAPQDSDVGAAAQAETQGEPGGNPTGSQQEADRKQTEDKAEPPPAPPHAPRTPSEARAMRMEQEARERAANGGAQTVQQGGEKPYHAMPVTFPKR